MYTLWGRRESERNIYNRDDREVDGTFQRQVLGFSDQ